MSNRSLIEINHDYAGDIKREPGIFMLMLNLYLASADRESTEVLKRFGVRVVGMRHHSDKFIIRDDAEGFPPQYLKGIEV